MKQKTKAALLIFSLLFIFSLSAANAYAYGPVVAITMDDVAGGSRYNLGVSELLSRNLRATLCVITSGINTTYGSTSSQIYQLYKQGFEIASHSYSHTILDQLSKDQLEREIVGSRQDMINAGAQVYTFSYPYGSGAYNSTVRSYVEKAGYQLAVKGLPEYWNLKNYDKYAIGRFTVFSDTTLDEFKKIVNSATGKKVALVLLYHDFTDSDTSGYSLTLPMKEFRKQLDYLKSVGATVLTVKQVYDLVSQPAPSGYLAGNKMNGALYYIFNGRKYYITTMSAFYSYGFSTANIKWNDAGINHPSEQIKKDYFLDGMNQLPDKPYIAGDRSDGSLFYIYGGNKYPITSMQAFYKYGFRVNGIRWGNAGLNLPWGYELNGINPLPTQPTSSGYLAGNRMNGALYYIFDGKKYYISSMQAFYSYGFSTANIKWNDAGINYLQAQFVYDYFLDGSNPLPGKPYLVGDRNDGSIYYVYNAKKYPVTSVNAFYAYGFNFNNVRWGDAIGLSCPDGVYALNGYSPPPDWFSS